MKKKKDGINKAAKWRMQSEAMRSAWTLIANLFAAIVFFIYLILFLISLILALWRSRRLQCG